MVAQPRMAKNSRIMRAKSPVNSVTLKDVAKRAGVAPITVSRAINDPESVSLALRTAVQNAVAELGYVRNRFAGALASAGSPIIPVLIPSLSNEVFIEVAEGIQEIFEAAGYEILIGNTHYDLARESELVRTFLGWSPPGIVLAGLKHLESTRQLLRAFARPVVEVMEFGKPAIDMNVGLSHQKAGRTMGEHLIARGYTEIGFVGGRLAADYRAAQRLAGLNQALTKASLRRRPPFTHESRTDLELGGEKLVEALQHDPTLDALFFANDDLAVGALLRANREGIDVPGKVAIAGFNGFDIGGLTSPGLTTIVSPRRLMGQMAAQKLLARMRNEDPGPNRVDVGYKLVIRSST
jgi:LacI family transcriptional regulator, gluconate utilization system Gnt-I transcriptional repressor